MSVQAADALFAAVIDDDGTRWGEIATPEQREDARALLDPEGERFQMLLRPRGGSKTTDLAAVLAVTLAFGAKPSDRMFAFASDRDQSRLLHDALAQIVRRTPLLRALQIGSYVVTAPSGASLQIMTADAASAYGLNPSWVACDELCWWPPGHERLWVAITSAMGKRRDSRLTVISAPSSPAHWSHRVYEHAVASPSWRVSRWPGPLAWMSEEFLAEQRAALTESDYRRLHLCEWAEGGEGLSSLDDIEAACVLDGPQPWQDGRQYVIGVDVGVVRDRTACAVGHLERFEGLPSRVVIDRLQVWKGSKKNPVDLSVIEGWLEQAHESYHRPVIYGDPWQFLGTAQNLRRKGARVVEFNFSSGAPKLASALYSVMRERRLEAPRDDDLIRELSTVRVIETTPGRMKIDNPPGEHDDMVTAVGLVALHLLARGEAGMATSINILDIRRAGRNPTIEHSPSGLTLSGARYLDLDPGSGLRKPPPAWRRRERRSA